jgi:KaiC/GvpD/RAD55 family RecA-like ATPase
MSELKITNLGINFLDNLLGGGFLSNSIIVISHQPGSKIRHLGLQIGLNKFNEKFHLINVTFHYSLYEVTQWLKFYTRNHEISKKVEETNIIDKSVTTIDCFNLPEEAEAHNEAHKIGNVYYVSNPFNIDNLLTVMAEARERVPEGQPVYWVFYHLTNMSIGVQEDELIKFCRRAFRYHKQHGDLAFYYLNERAHSNIFLAKLYQLSDAFIKVIVEETPRGLVNGVQVIKGVFPFESKKVFFDINEKGEIEVLTNKQVINPPAPIQSSYTEKRPSNGEAAGGIKVIRTGIPIVDALLGGGILSNSIVVATNQYGVRAFEALTQIFHNQLEDSHVININYHFSIEEFNARFKMLNKGVDAGGTPLKILQKGNLTIIDCLNVKGGKEGPEGNIYPVSNPFDVDKVLSEMTTVRNSIPEGKSVFWIFSTLTDMSVGLPEADVIRFCRKAFRYHKYCGDLALYTLTEQAHPEKFQTMLYQLSDVFIKFIGEDTPEGIDSKIQILKGVFNFSLKKTRYIINEKKQIQFLED